jgi:hypothetical protein
MMTASPKEKAARREPDGKASSACEIHNTEGIGSVKGPLDFTPEDFGLNPCPQTNRHQWMFKAAHALVANCFEDADIDQWITHHLTRPPKPREIEDTIKNVRAEVEGLVRQERWATSATYQPNELQKYADKASGFTIEDLQRKSPIATPNLTPSEFMRAISQAGEKWLIFDHKESQGQKIWTCPKAGETFDRDELNSFIKPARAKGAWFLIAPVVGERIYIERLKKSSRRTQECLTNYPYLLLESDEAPAGLWIKALARLPLAIVAIYESGNRSVHALIQTGAKDRSGWERERERIAYPLVTIGADPAVMKGPAQLSRLPQCFRGDKCAWQRLLYLNPSPSGEAIINQPDRPTAAQTKQPTGEQAQ